MTVFLAFAQPDRDTAENVEKFLERRGQFVELDDGQTAMRPIQASDVLVLLLSKDFIFSPARLRLEQRALDAWADGRLIVVKLDRGIAPVGLRDLPAIDASFAAQREFKWLDLANAIRERLRTQPATSEAPGAPAPPARIARKRLPLWVRLLFTVLLAAPGLFALYAAGAIWLVNRIGPRPGGWPELRSGIDDFGVRMGLTHGAAEWVFAAALGLLFGVLAFSLTRAFGRRPPASARPPAAQAEPAPQQSDAVFVSYARANQRIVVPVIEAAEQSGSKFWLDQKGITAGDGWAGEIVRAMRGAAGCVVMCSKAAFESDHVKREVYLADRYRKRLVPVFIENEPPPEDFEYFFAGLQSLNLFDMPEAERAQALLRVLGATA